MMSPARDDVRRIQWCYVSSRASRHSVFKALSASSVSGRVLCVELRPVRQITSDCVRCVRLRKVRRTASDFFNCVRLRYVRQTVSVCVKYVGLRQVR